MAGDVPKIEPVGALAVSAVAGHAAPQSERRSPVPAVPQPSARPVGEEMRATRAAVAQRLAQYLRESGRDVEFRVDEDAHATVITVRHAETGEVIRQFPTEEALRLLRRLNEQSGTFLDLSA